MPEAKGCSGSGCRGAWWVRLSACRPGALTHVTAHAAPQKLLRRLPAVGLAAKMHAWPIGGSSAELLPMSACNQPSTSPKVDVNTSGLPPAPTHFASS